MDRTSGRAEDANFSGEDSQMFASRARASANTLPPGARINVVVGRNIMAERQNCGMSSSHVAVMCNIASDDLLRIEAGEKRATGEQIVAIAELLETSVASLFRGAG